MSVTTVRLLLTPGEPAGIGPDLVVGLARRQHAAELVAVADPELLMRRAAMLGIELKLIPIDLQAPPAATPAGCLGVLPVTLGTVETPGKLDVANAPYVLETLRVAAAACQSGQAHALVTAPVQKSIINDAGIAFSGHTEFFSELTGAELPVMMLAAGSLRVALATTHLPLREVPDAITRVGLTQVLRTLEHDLRERFAIAAPRIVVCGLNPHAGEGGHLGREEIDTIAPTIEALKSQGLRLEGPLPADTVFTPRVLSRADAVLALFHDQGLTALKYAGFGQAVNITLGLPIIRTSVDHGTALDLAGTGRAESGSLQAALDMALQLARKSRRSGTTSP